MSIGTQVEQSQGAATWVGDPVPDRIVPPLAAAPCWQDADEAVLVCRTVLAITHDVKSFHFEPEGGGVFRFDPGQFITLRLEVNGQPLHRCYTISSPPTRPHLLSITVKRVVAGPVSNWLHDHVVPGTRLVAEAPLGAFALTGDPAPKYLFLSGGSGITPLMSMTRTLQDLGSEADVLFVHSARTPADIIFRRELEAIAAVHPNVRVVHVCEEDHVTERWMGLKGRLTTDMIRAIAPDLHERVTYTCGPGPYMDAVRQSLVDTGYDLSRYHQESFSFEPLRPFADGVAYPEQTPAPEQETAPAVDAATTFAVEFVRSGRTVEVRADEKILDAATIAGLRLPASCSQGVCGTCKLSKISGEVDMRRNGGIRPREIAQDKILICCSSPLSDLQLDA